MASSVTATASALLPGKILLAPFTIIKVKKHMVWPPNKMVVWIQQVEIISPGNQVGVKIGDPTPIGPDGKIPDQMEAKLTALR